MDAHGHEAARTSAGDGCEMTGQETKQAMAEFLQATPEGTVLNVRAVPRSSKAGIDGVVGDALKVRVRSAPVDGKANKELIEVLSDAFGLPKSAIVFKSGESAKTKRLLLRGVAKDAILSRV